MAAVIDGATLATLTVLAGADESELDGIAALMSVIHPDAGAIIGREGEAGHTFWLVLSGEVAVTRSGRNGERLLATCAAGSILGELAVLRHQPRTATVTAVVPSVLAVGDARVLERLLELDAVHERVRRLASDRLAHDVRPVATHLRDGSPVLIRPLLPEDREAFGTEVQRLSRQSLRRRFFSAALPSTALVDYLIRIDYVDHFAWVVIEAGGRREGLATARYVRTDRADTAEMAFGTADRFQGRGIGTLLLGALGVAAVEAGISTLVGHVLEDNASMRAVFAKARATIGFDEPGVIMAEIDPAVAADLLAPEVRQQLALAVHDIVTAASLALTHPVGPGDE